MSFGDKLADVVSLRVSFVDVAVSWQTLDRFKTTLIAKLLAKWPDQSRKKDILAVVVDAFNDMEQTLAPETEPQSAMENLWKKIVVVDGLQAQSPVRLLFCDTEQVIDEQVPLNMEDRPLVPYSLLNILWRNDGGITLQRSNVTISDSQWARYAMPHARSQSATDFSSVPFPQQVPSNGTAHAAPPVRAGPPGTTPDQNCWREYIQEGTNRPYYHNEVTNVTKWRLPAGATLLPAEANS